MTQPRSTVVSLDDTPWYHVVSRCVRRAFLCGHDAHSGRSFEHRRGWIADRLKQLASVFAVDIAAYAVMSNHFHIVVRVDDARVEPLERDEILRRWTQLFSGPVMVQRYLADPQRLGPAEMKIVDAWVETYRSRLADLSWFMRVLNESIARQANAEDRVTGRFWEGRFKSQALLDEQAVLTAMAYVDLNPIRARMAATPEASEYTSVAERIALLRETSEDEGAEAKPAAGDAEVPGDTAAPGPPRATRCDTRSTRSRSAPHETESPHPETTLNRLASAPLLPFDATGRAECAAPFAFEDYLELVEATGRVIREDKRGFIHDDAPPLLERLGIDPDQFIRAASRMLQQFGSAIGTPAHLTARCDARQTRYLRGMAAARQLFPRSAA
ncbi:transposase [Thioalkalivibrio sp. ALM2T]|uniref:transposase n=1 Tax=Thioalkalivibrio sp. ALM2T TaxID=1158184 RepID=UPI0003829001|nr:transposase [Thioalkalivibrio sp. ALM2T]